jgi:hypothetical protein
MSTWAVGVYDLGLTTARFLDLTYAQLLALADRRQAEFEREEMHFAVLALRIVQALGAKRHSGENLTLEDFMPRSAQPTRRPESESESDSDSDSESEPYMTDVEGAIHMLKTKFAGLGKWSTEPYGE